jgi:hypothetical protein
MKFIVDPFPEDFKLFPRIAVNPKASNQDLLTKKHLVLIPGSRKYRRYDRDKKI